MDICRTRVEKYIASELEKKELVIVISDFNMPIKTGLTAMKEITALYNIHIHNSQLNKDPRGKLYMPTFVMFTVHTGKAFIEHLKNNDVKYIIKKPPNKEEIFDIILNAIA